MLVPLWRKFVDPSAPTASNSACPAEVIERDSNEEISVMVLTAVENVDNPVDASRRAETTRV